MSKQNDFRRMVPRYPEDQYQLPRQLELKFAAVLKAISDFIECANKIADREKD